MRSQQFDKLEGYEPFFGFKEMPFGVAPNPRFLFETASYKAALAQVLYALDRRESLVVVTGEIGTGKTLLCRTVVERLERKTLVSVVNDPLLEGRDLLKVMLRDFGVISTDRTKPMPATRHELIQALEEFVVCSLRPIGAHAVVIVDEAHHLRPETLEQIRLLSNIGNELGIILVGQPDLEAMLARPELRQVQQRVSRRIALEPLSDRQVAAYIEHRVAIARGGSNGEAVFGDDAVDAVSYLSAGIPRVVNIVCDRALEAACSRDLRQVDITVVDDVAQALGLLKLRRLASTPPAAERPDERVPFAAVASTSARIGSRARWGFAFASSAALAAAVLVFRSDLTKRSGALEAPAFVSAPEGAAPVFSSTAPALADITGAAAPVPAGTSLTVAQPAPDPPTAPVESISGAFEIIVASFRTEERASAVAAEMAALDQLVRQRVAGGWQQVLIGPFASRSLADEAQQLLERAGFTGTQIIGTSR